MSGRPFDAILVVAFGGPEGLADVRPFLANVLRGRRVAPARVDEVARHYSSCTQYRENVVHARAAIDIAMAGAARYRAQLLESARLVAERLCVVDWALVFQSRSGRPEDPWLEPDICSYLRAERARGLAAAVICPIGFVCDHIEVLYDLDTEAAQVCREVDLPMARAATVNDDPMFVEMMADEVLKTWGRYRTGRPLSLFLPRPCIGRDRTRSSEPI